MEKGAIEYRKFPDGESYLRLLTDVKSRTCCILESLVDPDARFLRLFFLARKLKAAGAAKVILIAPYLAYMRQDREFQTGETVTSKHFAGLLSDMVDELVTVDPHLHRYKSMNEIYTIPVKVLHAAPLIAKWIAANIERPVIVGPDMESRQWVEEVAGNAGAGFLILEKTRKGDRDVEIHYSNPDLIANCTPVLVDDIISTARTMIETANLLKKEGLNPPVCIGVHGIFAGGAFGSLQQSCVARIVTSNSIIHETNAIDLAGLILDSICADIL